MLLRPPARSFLPQILAFAPLKRCGSERDKIVSGYTGWHDIDQRKDAFMITTKALLRLAEQGIRTPSSGSAIASPSAENGPFRRLGAEEEAGGA